MITKIKSLFKRKPSLAARAVAANKFLHGENVRLIGAKLRAENDLATLISDHRRLTAENAGLHLDLEEQKNENAFLQRALDEHAWLAEQAARTSSPDVVARLIDGGKLPREAGDK